MLHINPSSSVVDEMEVLDSDCHDGDFSTLLRTTVLNVTCFAHVTLFWELLHYSNSCK